MVRHTIRTTLLAWFLLIALAPLVFVAYLTYNTSVQTLREEVESNLSALAKDKADHIGTYFRERKKDVTILSHSSELALALRDYLDAFESGGPGSPEYLRAIREHREYLTYYKDGYGYRDLILIARNGEIVYSERRQKQAIGRNLRHGAGSDPELAKVFQVANTLLMTEISDFRQTSSTGQPSAFAAAPVLTDGKLLGIVALELGAEQVYELASDPTGLGRTGEILLVSRTGDNVLFVAPCRHDPDAAFRRQVKIGTTESHPIQEAASGKKGSGSYVDYRGKTVLAAWRYLPHLRLGLVVKIDAAEAFSPALRLRNLSLLVGLIAVVGVILAGLRVSSSIARPILTLKRGTQIVGGGDLDHKVGTTRSDEIGDLSRSFDTMTEDLKRTTTSVGELSKQIRQRQQAEQRERNVMAELERSNKELSQFAYVASHDLQEPLRKIVAFGGMLEDECGDTISDDGKDYLRRMHNAVNRMQTLINDLLTYSRVTTQGQPFVPVDLNDILRDVQADLDMRITETKGHVETGELPVIDADPTQMRQLFQNLIANALKYHKEGVDPVVNIWSQSPSSDRDATSPSPRPLFHQSSTRVPYCTIMVRDNGIGFDQKYADRIFAVFQRLHGRLEYEGTGIGLAICRNIVERHGGRIRAESRPGEGTTFTVSLPLHHTSNETGGEE